MVVTRLQGLKKRYGIKKIRIELERLEHSNLQKKSNRRARQTKVRNRQNIKTRQELEEVASADPLTPLTMAVVANKPNPPNQQEFLVELLERSA